VIGFLTSGSTWAILCCLAGVFASIMPWRRVLLSPVAGLTAGDWRGVSLGSAYVLRGTTYWHGIALGVVFGAGALLFLATYSAQGWRLWKPLAHALVGGVCLGFALAYVSMDDWQVIWPLVPSGGMVRGKEIIVKNSIRVPWVDELGWGLYVAGGAAVA